MQQQTSSPAIDPVIASREKRAFLFLAVVMAPAVSIAVVGGLGLAIWVFQMFAGPPGAPL